MVVQLQLLVLFYIFNGPPVRYHLLQTIAHLSLTRHPYEKKDSHLTLGTNSSSNSSSSSSFCRRRCFRNILRSSGLFLNFDVQTFEGLGGFQRNQEVTRGGGRHSTEVAFALLTQQPRVRILVLPIFLQLKYRAQHRENRKMLLRQVDSNRTQKKR